MELKSMTVEFLTSHWSIIVAFVIIFLTWYCTRTRRRLASIFPSVPGPKPLPFIGHTLDIIRHKGQLHLQFEEYYKKYGEVFSMAFFDIPTLVVSDAEMIKDVLVKNFDCFYNRPSLIFIPEPFDKGLDNAQGETWRRIRNIVSPTFSAHKLKAMVPIMNLLCEKLLKKVADAAESGSSFNIVQYQQALTVDVIMSAAFGIQTDYQSDPNDPVVRKVIKAMNPSTFASVLFFILPMLPFGNKFLSSEYGSNWLFHNLIDVKNIAQNVVDAKRKESTQKDFLDLMLNATSSDTTENKKLTDDEVVAQCVVFLLAGYETSSFTLSMMCYNLATHPDIQERLQQEIDSVWEDEEELPSYDTVRELPYLDMIMSETLRLYPPGLFSMRECNKECVIKGIKIPKDSCVLVPTYNIHRDPNIYPNPEKFDPERFTADAKQSRNPYLYIPFGHGPRNCIGMRFAQMEIKLVVARLLKKYSFVVTPETKTPELEVKATLTVSDAGIQLGVVKRQ